MNKKYFQQLLTGNIQYFNKIKIEYNLLG